MAGGSEQSLDREMSLAASVEMDLRCSTRVLARHARQQNGKPPSSQSLHQRIRYHYNGNAEGPTLRKTLGVLLAGELGIELRRVGSGTRRTFGTVGEAALTRWMADNALVYWVVRPEPRALEEELIATLDVRRRRASRRA